MRNEAEGFLAMNKVMRSDTHAVKGFVNHCEVVLNGHIGWDGVARTDCKPSLSAASFNELTGSLANLFWCPCRQDVQIHASEDSDAVTIKPLKFFRWDDCVLKGMLAVNADIVGQVVHYRQNIAAGVKEVG